jgi:mannose-6-phosphate isomerase
MKSIERLQNTVQPYAWGSSSAIPQLLGQNNPSGAPWAELWMGAHPKAPSQVIRDGRPVSLAEIIRNHPQDILGPDAARRFNNRLPFLFKVLAAAKPLSIQAHPDLEQARAGFKRENEQHIALDAPHRNYRDDNHKPECICALTEFVAMHGFREIPEITSLLGSACPESLAQELRRLKSNPNWQGLKQFYRDLMNLDENLQKAVVAEALLNIDRTADPDMIFWMKRLNAEYPGDIGILSPILLNLIRLKPGQALFLPAGELHAYLEGLGIELMANSDNVLRGGLTPKHIDLPELMRVVRFEPRPVTILKTEKQGLNETVYVTPADEFALSTISVSSDAEYQSGLKRGAEILLCTEGKGLIQNTDRRQNLEIHQGQSILVPAAVGGYRISGNAIIYKAGTPLE